MKGPRFIHDCHRCTYLGSDDEADFYHCDQGGIATPTVIARFGDNGEDYASGLCCAPVEPKLAESERRARARGLLR